MNGTLNIDGVPYPANQDYDDSELQAAKHTHANKDSLDKITIANGTVYINGVPFQSNQDYDDTALNAQSTERRR